MRSHVPAHGRNGVSLLLVLAALLVPAAVDAASSLRIGGTGGDLGTIRLLADALERSQPGVTVAVLPSISSTGGIKAVLAGAIDLGVSSRPLRESERAAGARAAAYARTALVFAARAGSPAAAFTTAEIVAIIRGSLRAWPDGRRLRLVLRNESDGDIALLKALSPDVAPALVEAYARPEIAITYTDQENADLIETVAGALGVTSLSLVLGEGRALSPVRLNGVAPTPETVADGTYPMIKPYYFVTRGEPDGLAGRFIALARSDEGRAILLRTGHAAAEQGKER